MSDAVPEAPEPGDEQEKPLVLPPWVPAAIGIALLTMASLAIYTGLRYRRETAERSMLRKPRVSPVYEEGRGGVPGEPGPGASRVLPGDGDENFPQPRTSTSKGTSRLEISSENGGVVSRIRISARRGIMIRVEPRDAVVYVNDRAVGMAHQFSTADQIYEFPSEGTFEIRLVAAGFNDAEFVVTADPAARDEVGRLELKLVPAAAR